MDFYAEDFDPDDLSEQDRETYDAMHGHLASLAQLHTQMDQIQEDFPGDYDWLNRQLGIVAIVHGYVGMLKMMLETAMEDRDEWTEPDLQEALLAQTYGVIAGILSWFVHELRPLATSFEVGYAVDLCDSADELVDPARQRLPDRFQMGFKMLQES